MDVERAVDEKEFLIPSASDSSESCEDTIDSLYEKSYGPSSVHVTRSRRYLILVHATSRGVRDYVLAAVDRCRGHDPKRLLSLARAILLFFLPSFVQSRLVPATQRKPSRSYSTSWLDGGSLHAASRRH